MCESETTAIRWSFDELLDLFDYEPSSSGIKLMTFRLDNEDVFDFKMKVAQHFKESGSVVLAIGVLPFYFAGERTVRKSLQRTSALGKVADGILLINKKSLMNAGCLEPEEVGSTIHRIACENEEGLEELLLPGTPEIDSASLKEALKDCGSFIVTRGTGKGSARLAEAFMEAVTPKLFPNLNLYTSRRAFIKVLVPENEPPTKKESTILLELISVFPRHSDVIVSASVSDTVEVLTVVMLGISFDVRLPDLNLQI